MHQEKNVMLNTINQIPAIHELVDYQEGLDEQCVIKHFLGLSQEEAASMIIEETPFPYGVYTEDLMWLSDRGFAYYFPAFVEASIKICEQKGKEYAEEICSGIIISLLFHAETNPQLIMCNRDSILIFLHFIDYQSIFENGSYSDEILTISNVLKDY